MPRPESQPGLIHRWHLERLGHPSTKTKPPLPRRLLRSCMDGLATALDASFFNGLNCLPHKHAFSLSMAAGVAQRLGAASRSMTNMRFVLGMEGRSTHDWKRLWAEHQRHVGTTAIESIHFGSMDREELLDRVRLEGEDHLRAALNQGRGVMLFLNHVGNVGCIPAALGPRGYDLSITGNAMPRPYLEKKVTKLYEHGGVKRILVGEQLPFKAARIFKRNGIFATFMDYTVVEKLNYWLPFGNAELNTNIGPAILALRNNATILYATCRRLPHRGHCLTIHRPDAFAPTGDTIPDALTVTTSTIDFIARELQLRPEQWWPWDCAQLRPKPNVQAAQDIFVNASVVSQTH
ncbi:lysophospholipid acyltransferase family protein [Pedosphaera parvula]|uniref:Lipid A biosynthesis acyltransferase n=1 Tax=Pedosphaera parvula (strain Ellin514) TaxID=320771 RepID=B9XGH4_PEDPL|nr:lysophospholipid acyltransferase family protein [Pedosphaera parvula]EEF61025.1 lipid A biosynthesis acyltransferase [Pedosphaera parvula Ellin514]